MALRGTSKQFRWTKPMERIFLEILSEEAQKGNKPSNTFKQASLARVATIISEKYNTECNTKHVENHLRTVKNAWKIICQIRGQSGFGWEESLKMITCDGKTHVEIVTAHPKYEPFLNKRIDMYDEMALVVGQDMADGSLAKNFTEIVLDANKGSEHKRKRRDVDTEDDNEENADNEEIKASSTSGISKRQRKKKKESVGDDQVEYMGDQLGEIAKALAKFNEDNLVMAHLYGEVMSMEKEGFDDEKLCAVFDFLGRNEVEAKMFLVKSAKHRKIWLQNFSQT